MKDKHLGEVIIEAIKSYGDETLARSLIWHMENRKKMSVEDIADRPDDFVSFLKEVYGPFEPFIEEHIIQSIAKEYGVPEQKGLVAMIKSLYEKNT